MSRSRSRSPHKAHTRHTHDDKKRKQDKYHHYPTKSEEHEHYSDSFPLRGRSEIQHDKKTTEGLCEPIMKCRDGSSTSSDVSEDRSHVDSADTASSDYHASKKTEPSRQTGTCCSSSHIPSLKPLFVHSTEQSRFSWLIICISTIMMQAVTRKMLRRMRAYCSRDRNKLITERTQLDIQTTLRSDQGEYHHCVKWMFLICCDSQENEGPWRPNDSTEREEVVSTRVDWSRCKVEKSTASVWWYI